MREESQFVIDILIPTYNRSRDLESNLIYLTNQINKYELNSAIKIIISDNCSIDNTRQMVEKFIKTNSSIVIDYHRTDSNIGLEKNMLNVLSKSTSKFVLWNGDDDILDEGYIQYCLDMINISTNLGCIITGITKVLEDGTRVPIRNAPSDEVYLSPGYETILNYSYLGHQLSGLLMIRENLLENYLSIGENRNIYLFIYFVADRMHHYETIFTTKFRTTVPVFNEKDWSYNKVGLLDEVFKSYYPFIRVFGNEKVGNILLNFLKQQSAFRLRINFFKPFRLAKQYVILVKLLPFFSWSINVKIMYVLFKEYLISLKRIGQKA